MHTRRVSRVTLAGLAAVLAVAGLAGCRTSPNVAAYVGDATVSVAQLQSAKDARRQDADIEAYAKKNGAAFTRQVLSVLVGREVYAAAAEHWHVSVSDAEVRDRIDTLLAGQDAEQVYAQEAAQGISRQDVFEIVREQLYRQEIARAEGKADALSESALRQQYQQNLASYEQYSLGVIGVGDQATADTVLAQLEADPASYPTLAAQFANQITAPELQTVPADQLSADLAKSVQAAAPNTGFAVPVSGGVAVVFVAGATAQPFEDVRAQLVQSASSTVDASATKLVQKFRDSLEVTVNPRYGVLKDNGVVADDAGVVRILSGSGAATPSGTIGG